MKFINPKDASNLSVMLMYLKEGLQVPQYILKKLKSKIAKDISNALLKNKPYSLWARKVARKLMKTYD